MKLKQYPGILIVCLLGLVLSACGGAATTPSGGEAAATTAPAAGGAAEATAAPAAADATAPAAGEAAPTEAAPAAEAGAPTPSPAIAFEEEAKEGQKTIVWMTRSNNITEVRWEHDVVLPAYAKANPNVFVKVLSINQADIAVKREAMIAAKEPLHVWSTNWGGDGFASDRARGLIADLTPLIDRDKFDMSDFLPDVLKIYQSEGKTWGLPFLTTGSYVYYNKKIFDDAKIPYPPTDWDDTSWTWDKFKEIGKQLTKNYDDPNNAIYGANVESRGNMEGVPMIWGHFVWQDNAYTTGLSDKITVTDDTSVKAFQAVHDLTYKDKIAPDPATVTALGQLGGVFQTGRVAMNLNGGWGHWVYKDLINDPNGFCWGAAPIPMGSPDAKQRAVLYTDPWVITGGLSAEEQDLAWDFLKYLAGPESSKALTDATGTPPTRSSLLKNYYQAYAKCQDPADVEKVFQGAFSHGRESSNHLLIKWDQLDQTWTNSFITPFFDNPDADAKTVLTDAETQMNAALDQIRSEQAK